MNFQPSADARLPSGTDSGTWELFHENSKLTQYTFPPPDQEVAAVMQLMWECLPYKGYSVIQLPTSRARFHLSLAKAIETRVTCRKMVPCRIQIDDLATILHCAYGITRDNSGSNFPRPFRTVPSGGALYPLEIFFHSTMIDGAAPGLYHYNPKENTIRHLRAGDGTVRIAEAMIQKNIATEAALIFFITAIFERATFKYGDRGYRFALIEAGHVAQNVNLVANGLKLGSINIGGFFDQAIDDFLELDGLTHSTIYMIAIGKSQE